MVKKLALTLYIGMSLVAALDAKAAHKSMKDTEIRRNFQRFGRVALDSIAELGKINTSGEFKDRIRDAIGSDNFEIAEWNGDRWVKVRNEVVYERLQEGQLPGTYYIFTHGKDLLNLAGPDGV